MKHKPANESHTAASFFGTQIRYVSTRRIRKLRARWRKHGIQQPARVVGTLPQYRHVDGKIWSYLRPYSE